MSLLHIVLLGEVDSGKSTLIGRLLYDTASVSIEAKEELKKTCKDLGKPLEFAYLLDSFEEEREGEFTLDTTQAVLKFSDREYVLIDVPGHRELLNNMLTGLTLAQAVILVIDIEKPISEQIRRNAYILKFLGIEAVIIAVNKMDRVLYNMQSFNEAKEKINAFLKEAGLFGENIIPVSALSGKNLLARAEETNWYGGLSLIEALDKLTPKEEAGSLRFLVQDIYKIRGNDVTAGMIVSGEIKKGQLVSVSGKEKRLAVKTIATLNKNLSKASTPGCIGLIFNRMDGVSRGDILYDGIAPLIVNDIEAKIFCLDSLEEGSSLVFKCAAQETPCEIISIKERIDTATFVFEKTASTLKKLDAADVIIRTKKRVTVENFKKSPWLGRFVLERGGKICAIGIIDY